MYCPTCGANQPNDKKFCPACGTNLAVVTVALSGQLPATSPPDTLVQAQAAYRKQIALAISRGAPGVGLLLAALMLLIIFPWGISGWIAFGLVIGGVSTLGKGLSHYYLARAGLKAAELEAQHRLPSSPSPATAILSAANPNSETTNPYPPRSVTEHTTRHLG